MPDTARAVDPITLEVVKNALASTADEMALVIMRSAYSPGRARHDGLLDGALRPQRPGRRAGPHARRSARDVPDRDAATCWTSSASTAQPGDVYIANDPYGYGGQHLPDIYVIQPIFVDGDARGLRGDDGAPLRRRRNRAGKRRRARDRDLPGRAPDPALEALRRRRREHDAAAADRGEHPPAGARARRPAGSDRSVPRRGARADGAARALRHRRTRLHGRAAARGRAD